MRGHGAHRWHVEVDLKKVNLIVVLAWWKARSGDEPASWVMILLLLEENFTYGIIIKHGGLSQLQIKQKEKVRATS